MNEQGLVINWMLTRGESLKEGRSILEQAKRQSDGIDMIVTGKFYQMRLNAIGTIQLWKYTFITIHEHMEFCTISYVIGCVTSTVKVAHRTLPRVMVMTASQMRQQLCKTNERRNM
jgi:hypothetical protein